MAYGKTKMGKKLNTITEPGDDRRRIDPPKTGGDRKMPRPNIVKPTTPKFRPKLTKGAR